MDHSRRKPGGGQGGHAQQHVGQVADGGPGQTAFQVLGAQRLGGAVHNGKDGHRHHQVLGPGAPKESGTIAVPGQAGDGKHARLYHRHRMEQSGHRRGGHRGPQQPLVAREHRRLYAKAKKSKHISCPQCILLASWTHHAASQEEHRSPVLQQHDHGQKAQGCPAHGVGEVHPPGIPGLAVHGVHHQGQGGQGEQLVEEVHGQGVGGEGDAQGHAEAGQIEGKKAVLMALPAHILHGVQAGQRPQHRHQSCKQAGQAIHPERNGQVISHVQQREERAIPQGKYRPQSQGSGDTGRSQHVVLPGNASMGTPGR